MKDKDNYSFPDSAGRFGEYGGKYVSENSYGSLRAT